MVKNYMIMGGGDQGMEGLATLVMSSGRGEAQKPLYDGQSQGYRRGGNKHRVQSVLNKWVFTLERPSST